MLIFLESIEKDKEARYNKLSYLCNLTKIDVNMQDETVWLSLEQMSDLF